MIALNERIKRVFYDREKYQLKIQQTIVWQYRDYVMMIARLGV